LRGWLDEIESVVRHPIEPETVMDVPYQMIHRTASACTVDRPRRYVVYQVFGSSTHDRDDLSGLAQLLKASGRIGFALWKCRSSFRDGHRELFLARPARGQSRASDVRSALLAGSVLDFAEADITTF
jgi:hypothetical protein